MSNLRLINIAVIDSSTIRANFNFTLDDLINSANVSISANDPSVPSPQVLDVTVNANVLNITTQLLASYFAYFVTFQSTTNFPFKSLDGSAYLYQDGVTNVVLILGPEDPSNPVRDTLLSYQKDNVYNLEPQTKVRDLINAQSNLLAKGLYDIGQAKNDNYLSFTVIDEIHTRGTGPYDRFFEEGVYEVIRVGTALTGTTATNSITVDSFSADSKITLLGRDVTNEKLVAGFGASTFNGFLLTVSQTLITKVYAIRIAYQDGSSTVYDLSEFGYYLLDSSYDSDVASTLFSLNNNQIQLNNNVLINGFRLPEPGDFVYIDYQFKQLGIIIDESSVEVFQILPAVREVVQPILNQFTLDHAPVVTAVGGAPVSNGVQFLDPSADIPFSTTHPAFLTEIAFRLDRVPTFPGEFAVDYISGTVLVYGAVINDGTGDFPPVANYYYQQTYSDQLDFTYDPDTSDLVINPLRSLVGESAFITYNYELTLVPNVDFIAQIHTEALNERVNNKLTSLSSLSVINTPITNVFRIYNETTGEIYTIARWSDSQVYFTSSTPPNIETQIRERASFTNVPSELLLVNDELINGSSVKIFKLLLQNNRIISATEDCIGSSFNSSVSFSRNDIFVTELYFDSVVSLEYNLDRLIAGYYLIDYQDGVIYVGVSHAQNYDLGTINYKKSTIKPQFPHVISVIKIYNSLNNLLGPSDNIDYLDFGDGFIQPSSFDVANERFLNGDTDFPYFVDNGTITVTDDIKLVRSIYDVYDLDNNIIPTNFADNLTTFINNIITLDINGIPKQTTSSILAGLNIIVPTISPGIQIAGVSSVLRISDGYEFWQPLPGTFVNNTITLSGYGNPMVGDTVQVLYSVGLNGGATPVVDYDRGGYYIDYTYLADEILVSYEYGDNRLDFRQSNALAANDIYYVSYKAGALRQALLQNFGMLVNLPILNSLDTDFPRENYRDALIGALQSFPKGPTIPAISNIVSSITHIVPQIIETGFDLWSLGVSRLYQIPVKVVGSPQFLAGKYGSGVLMDTAGTTISFPVSSNLRIEEGTLEFWAIPEWNGLDNDATLTFSIQLNGSLIDPSQIFIGATSYNPIYDSNDQFSIQRLDVLSPIGFPATIYTQTSGVFIYYDIDKNAWKMYAKDAVNLNNIYSGTIISSGEVYNVKFIDGLGEVNDTLRSGLNRIDFTFNIDSSDATYPDGYNDVFNPVTDGYSPGDGYVNGYSFDGICWMADDEHYLFDFGSKSRNRFSIYKDGKGYLNFRVYDRGVPKISQYKLSADISNWLAGQQHFISVAWRLNSPELKDEMHLFIDGQEVPNLFKYGGRPAGSNTDRFGSVGYEVVATVAKNAVAGNDLVTTSGLTTVTSASTNFQSLGIAPGDLLTINELGFGAYTISIVSSHTLTLSAPMPASLTNAVFSVNEFSTVVQSEIDLYPNILVYVLRGGEEIELAGTRAIIPEYSISQNGLNQNVLTILGDVIVGDQIVIKTVGLNHKRIKERIYQWSSTSNFLRTPFSPPINLDTVSIKAVLLPLVIVGPSNSTLSVGSFIGTFTTTQTTNIVDGRSLSVRITGGNVDFTTLVSVAIHGTTLSGPTTETIMFGGVATRTTINFFISITSIVVTVKPIDPTSPSIGIEVMEANSLLVSEDSETVPIITYSYQSAIGYNLNGSISNPVVYDTNQIFLDSYIGQKLVILNPPSVAGTYTITSRTNNTTIVIDPPPSANFSGAVYQIFDITLARSGFQNGVFYFQLAQTADTPYLLPSGVYEFDYETYLTIPFDPVSGVNAYFGTDINGQHPARAVLDELRILSTQLTDVRIGEPTITSITTDYNKVKEFEVDSTTLMLMHCDDTILNEADYWVASNKEYIQSGNSVNDNFGQSLVIIDKPFIIDNAGYLSTISEGTIEFWISPRHDTYNDIDVRYYFDAAGITVENIISLTKTTVKIVGKASSIVSIRLATDTNQTGTNYFGGQGSILPDNQTIQLNQPLPFQQTPIVVSYITNGSQGNRISIYKDGVGTLNFEVWSQGKVFNISHSIFWQANTWHRIMATYQFNRKDNNDRMRMFVDGEEKDIVYFGAGNVFGDGLVFGQESAATELIADINFYDGINQLFIGSDYLGTKPAMASFDNLRLSDKARVPLTVAGQMKDFYYTSNIALAEPVVPDAFTTYLLDFDSMITKTTDFALLINETYGIFDFTINVIDTFGIVSGNAKIKQVLENLISVLKPANSTVSINYD